METSAALDRTFRLIVFDWDGTAVESRHVDATAVRRVIERLLRAGVLVAVVTGTNVVNVGGQLSAAIRGPHESNLLLCTNRGSEVYGFDGASPPRIRVARRATPEEDAKLTAIAESVAREITARTGLAIDVVRNRLNRRKIDLIPLERWRDPPKSAIPALVEAVQSRLRDAGLQGGLHEAFEMTERACRELGLPDARVTSDVKHIEVGLTDKSDSVRWLLSEVAAPRGIANEQILIAGDELGPVAGFPGSDDKMVVPEACGAVFVSVGPEPGGVPPPVLHLGGGPPRFLELLGDQAERHPVRLPAEPTDDPAWVLVEGRFVPGREHEVESIFALGNGHVGSRGSVAEGTPLSAPATYVAGVFHGSPEAPMPTLLALPDWARVGGAVDGSPLRLSEGDWLSHRRVLDMRQGILWRQWRHRDEAGRVTRVEALRFASLADRHLLVQSILLTPENYSGRVAVEGAPVVPTAVRTDRGVGVAFALLGTIEEPRSFGVVPASFEVPVSLGRSYRGDRIFDVEKGCAGDVTVESAAGRLERAVASQGLEGIVQAHREAWQQAWRRSDVRVDGDLDAQRALRFAVYHLVSAADPDDPWVSIGARGLTGGGYGGHVFWDTEVYMLPFFVWTWPEAARALLMYRFHTLPAARARAAKMGYRGALYAWESADTGEDVTPRMFATPDGRILLVHTGEREHHISADVAWAVWTYWQTTGDDAFLLEAGAEIVIETARFWASRARRADDGSCHIDGVEGPDEYHDLVDDDAFTNGMARWNLERGAELARRTAQRWPERWRELASRLELGDDEPDRWREIAARLHLVVDPSTGLIEQFRGYFDLEPLDLAPYARRRTPMPVLLGHERIARSQILKQPDVVMLLYLLWDRFPPAVREANFRFYDARTDHGSSLSPPVHAAVAARLGDVVLAERYFRQTMAIDFDDDMGNAAAGVHVGALGGLWQAAVFGFAGLEAGARGPVLRPHLPPRWKRLSFAVQWRGERHELTATPTAAAPVEPRLAAGAP